MENFSMKRLAARSVRSQRLILFPALLITFQISLRRIAAFSPGRHISPFSNHHRSVSGTFDSTVILFEKRQANVRSNSDGTATEKATTVETFFIEDAYKNPMKGGEMAERALIVNNEPEDGEKYLMLGLLWIIALLSALDRVAMSVALVPMSAEFGFTDTIKGSISSLFSVGYGLAILPAGLVVANASPKLVLACGIALWSLATIATPESAQLLTLATGATLIPLLFVRACVGAGESLVIPTVQKLLTVWTNPDQKALALAWIFSGFQTGTIAAYLLSPAVMDTFGGWRALFYAYGGVGLAMMIPWLLLARDVPRTNKALNDDDSTTTLTFATTTGAQTSLVSQRKYETTEKESKWDESVRVFKEAPWNDFLRSKGSWAMLLAHCAKNWGLYNTLAWTPTFYAEEYGIGVRESAVLSVLPSVAGAIGGFVAGSVSDSILRKMQENDDYNDENAKTKLRKIFQGIGLYGPALSLGFLATHVPEDAFVAQTFLTVAVGLQAFNAAGFEAANQDKAGSKWAGLLYSVTSLPAVMFGTFGVWFTGRVLDATSQDWGYVFGLTAIINILGATAFVLLFDSKREFD